MRPTINLVISIAAPEHHALLRKVRGKERYLHRDEAYIIGMENDHAQERLLVLREPGKADSDIKGATQRAIQLFQPDYAFLLGTATGASGLQHGDVVVANQLLQEPGDWMYGHTDAFLAHYLDSLQSAGQNSVAPEIRLRRGHLVGSEEVLPVAYQAQPSALWAIAPQAEGFFNALQSDPKVSGLAILGIKQPHVGTEIPDETTPNPTEQAVSAALELWRRMDVGAV
jgi:hypothetical protein